MATQSCKHEDNVRTTVWSCPCNSARLPAGGISAPGRQRGGRVEEELLEAAGSQGAPRRCDGGSRGSDREQRLGLAAVERVGTGPPQRLQSALLPRGEQRGPRPYAAGGPLPAVGAAGQELHQRLGDPQEGRMAREAARLPGSNGAHRILIGWKLVFVSNRLLRTRKFNVVYTQWILAECFLFGFNV